MPQASNPGSSSSCGAIDGQRRGSWHTQTLEDVPVNWCQSPCLPPLGRHSRLQGSAGSHAALAPQHGDQDTGCFFLLCYQTSASLRSSDLATSCPVETQRPPACPARTYTSHVTSTAAAQCLHPSSRGITSQRCVAGLLVQPSLKGFQS